MKLTRDCLLAWSYYSIYAGGLIQPCCPAPDADYGDVILDYCEEPDQDKRDKIFDTKSFQELRKGLLTGNLRKECQSCYWASTEYITTDELQNKVKIYLEGRNIKVSCMEDLYKKHALEQIGFSLTNRCNLRCIYCNQSYMADKSPYYKIDFPLKYVKDVLELIVKEKVQRFVTGAEGEPTFYPGWYEIINNFHLQHPEIELVTATNLSRKYTKEELELLTEYKELRVSIDSLDENTYQEIRQRGNLSLVLQNLDMIKSIKEQEKKAVRIVIWSVLTNKTWKSLENLGDFAFGQGFDMKILDYEKRPNTIGTRKNILEPIDALPVEEQNEIQKMLLRMRKKAKENHVDLELGEGAIVRTSKILEGDSNRFKPYNGNEVLEDFYNNHKASENMHLDIVYDHDNISYEGILFSEDSEIEFKNLECKKIIYREVYVYKKGKCSPKYNQSVLPGYRKRLEVKNRRWRYRINFQNDEVEAILLEIISATPEK